MASSPITPWEIDGETVETVSDFIFGTPKSLQMVIAAMKLKDLLENSRALSPWGPLNFLETCLGNDSLRNMIEQPFGASFDFPWEGGSPP